MKNLIKTTFISICSLLTFTASLTLQGQTVAQLQTEIDAIETGAGLEDDGSYAADATTNYLTGATSLKDADKALDTALQAESTSRTNTDTQLQNNINAEASARGSADTALQGDIDSIETGAGLGADGSYTADATTNYLTGATSLKDADKALDTALQAESTARTNADTAMQADIDQNELDGDTVDAQLQNNINTEASARGSADTAMQTDIDQNELDSDTADTQLQNNINTLASASQTADTNIQGDIDQNELDSDTADTQLQNNINAESTARIDADALLRTDIDNSLANIDLNRADISRNTSDIQRNREGIAMVAAMTHTTLLPGNDVALDIGIANFESETAYSINFARRVKEGVQVNLSAASTSGLSDAVVRGSIGFQW